MKARFPEGVDRPWYQLWKDVEAQYSLIEKQLVAMYVTLLASEALIPSPCSLHTWWKGG